MFYNCTNLTTIYASTNFVTTGVTNSTNMFYNNTKLKGGNGTSFSSSNIDKTYARIDATSTPGYFSRETTTMLLQGQELNYKIKNSYAAQDFETSKVTFGYLDDYADVVSWDNYESYVDVNNEGKIRLFRKLADDGSYNVYILSEDKIYANQNCYNMFYNLRTVEQIEFENFDTSYTTTMRQMFYMYDTVEASTSSSLKTLDLSGFDLSNVTNIRAMFAYNSALESVNISNWNTNKVTDMAYLFQACENLKSIDVSGFNTSNVVDMEGMFIRCGNIETLDLSSFDTSKVTDMHTMFDMTSKYGNVENAKLKTIYVSNKFVTNKVNTETEASEDAGHTQEAGAQHHDPRREPHGILPEQDAAGQRLQRDHHRKGPPALPGSERKAARRGDHLRRWRPAGAAA